MLEITGLVIRTAADMRGVYPGGNMNLYGTRFIFSYVIGVSVGLSCASIFSTRNRNKTSY